jgi:hypothetical protein
MPSPLSQLWSGLKATLAIGLLAAGSLYSAKLVDERGLNPFAAALGEPAVTGSIQSGRAR